MITPSEFIVAVMPWTMTDHNLGSNSKEGISFEKVQAVQIRKLESAIAKTNARITPNTRTYVSHHRAVSSSQSIFAPLLEWVTSKKGADPSYIAWRPYGTAPDAGQVSMSENGSIKIRFLPAKPAKKDRAAQPAKLTITWLPLNGAPAVVEEIHLA